MVAGNHCRMWRKSYGTDTCKTVYNHLKRKHNSVGLAKWNKVELMRESSGIYPDWRHIRAHGEYCASAQTHIQHDLGFTQSKASILPCIVLSDMLKDVREPGADKDLSPLVPLAGKSDVQSTGACPLLSGWGCFINEPIEWVQAEGWPLLTVGSTLGGRPGEWEWLGVRRPIPVGASANNVLPGGPQWRHFWQMDSFSGAVLRGSGLCCWLIAGLPAHRHARFFICTLSPELRQQLIMRPCTHERMGWATKDTQVYENTYMHTYTQPD